MMVTDPPGLFTVPPVLCPSCGHGIDPHGLDPGSACGVGDESGTPCPCLWSPNDIAFTLMRAVVADSSRPFTVTFDSVAANVIEIANRTLVKEIVAAIEVPKVHYHLHTPGYRIGYDEGRRDAAGIARSFLAKESNDG